MKFLGNLLWLIFGGLESAIGYFTGSIALAITIVGIPWAWQTFKIGLLCLWPFGATIEDKNQQHGCLNLFMNVIWFFCGGLLAWLSHIFWGLLLYITIIGIPFGKQQFKLARLSVAPFGKDVIPSYLKSAGPSSNTMQGLLFVLLSSAYASLAYSQEWTTIVNGTMWTDSDGRSVQAHGAGFLQVGDTWYMIGEDRASSWHPDVNMYSSKDLQHWKFEGKIIENRKTHPDLGIRRFIERPKILWNKKTGRFVVWCHWEGSNYGASEAGVFVSDNVTGPYTYHWSGRPLGIKSRDCNVFQDDDGTAYFISTIEENQHLGFFRLSDDYLQAEECTQLFKGMSREAPALVKVDGTYFMLSSACTGWNPNQCKLSYSRNITSGWSRLENIGDKIAYDTQAASILTIKGTKQTTYLYVGDRWMDPSLPESKTIIFPLVFKNGKCDIIPLDRFEINFKTGEWKSAQSYPFQDPSLSPAERAENLCSLLTLDEKARLMEHTSPAIPRLGIPEFNWWNEALHGVGRNGTATVLPITMAMAASFDHPLVQKAYDAVSDEARAKNNIARKDERCKIYEGLSFWTPNINIFRDPRWGRGQETYGEDPFLTTQMGLSVVRGLQGEPGHKYQKLFACAKHFAVHSGPEWNRHSFNIESLPPRDLYETYLPAFKALVQQGDVKEVMCAYQSIDNEPCCGSNRLLQQILRDDWGFKGIVTSDCWALNDFWNKSAHGISADKTEGISKALYAGTDVECGNAYSSLSDAVAAGKVTEEQMNISLKRLLQGRFELGDFDADSLVEWRNIGPEVIASKEHRDISRQLARESIVLLQNRDNLLPLSRNMKVAVLGPNAADSVMLWGNYNGFPSHTVTILDGIRSKNPDASYFRACGLVERTATDSWFDNIRCFDGIYTGLGGYFYNNQNFEGTPATRSYYQTAMKFDNGGATAFAQGVNLENFSALFEGVLQSNTTETITFSLRYSDKCMLVVDKDTLLNDWTPRSEDRVRSRNINFTVEQGRTYKLELRYAQNTGNAVLSFDVGHQVTYTDEQILSSVADADVVVFVGGISPRLEGEEMRVSYPGFKGGDRTDIELPQVQRDMLALLHKAGKKVVYVNCSGSAIGLVPETENADAILQAWYGGECGGDAVADVLFGDCNPSGKLPVTFYRNVDQLPDFLDYTMKGRTYRYMTEQPLFPFGFGLSYTGFNINKVSYKKGKVSAVVSNNGTRDGDEVVQVYIRRIADTDGPQKTLRGYQRVSVPAGGKVNVSIPLSRDSFEGWDPATNTMRVVPGKYEIMVGNSSRDTDLFKTVVNVK